MAQCQNGTDMPERRVEAPPCFVVGGSVGDGLVGRFLLRLPIRTTEALRTQLVPLVRTGEATAPVARLVRYGAICTDILHFRARVLVIHATRGSTGERC